jgi:hypothetical protein
MYFKSLTTFPSCIIYQAPSDRGQSRRLVERASERASVADNLAALIRFIELLAPHPYFELHVLAASSRSAGQEYAKIVKWKLNTPIPEKVKKMVVQECSKDAPGMKDCGVVFSGLDHDVAGDIGEYEAELRSCFDLAGIEADIFTAILQRHLFDKPSSSSSQTPKTTDEIPSSLLSFRSSTLRTFPSLSTNVPASVCKRGTSSATPTARPLELSSL